MAGPRDVSLTASIARPITGAARTASADPTTRSSARWAQSGRGRVPGGPPGGMGTRVPGRLSASASKGDIGTPVLTKKRAGPDIRDPLRTGDNTGRRSVAHGRVDARPVEDGAQEGNVQG